jgi:hypothetical protein
MKLIRDSQAYLKLKDLPHVSHWWGRSPEWIRQCILSCCLFARTLPQISHEWLWFLSQPCRADFDLIPAFTLSCANFASGCFSRMCFIRESDLAKALRQTWQWNGRSPVWRRSCFRKFSLAAYVLPQLSQEKGRSPVWTLLCVRSKAGRENDFGHSEQRKDFLKLNLA